MTQAATPASKVRPPVLQVRREAVVRPDRFRLLVFGASGLGKTTLGADLHGPDREALSIYLTPPQSYSTVQDRPHLVVERLADLEQIVERFDFTPYDGVTIDDAQALWAMIVERVEADTGVDFEAESDMGKKNWREAKRYLFGLWTLLSRRVPYVCLTSGETDAKTIVSGVCAIRPNLPPSIWKSLEPDLDLVGWARAGTPSPADPKPANTIQFTPDKMVPTKDRWSIMGPRFPLDGRLLLEKFRTNQWTPRVPITK